MKDEPVGPPGRRLEFLDRPEVTRVLFHPRRDPSHRPRPPRSRAVRLEVEQGVALSGRLYLGESSAPAHDTGAATNGDARPDSPTILLFHGNGEIAADYDGISPAYTDLGINLLAVDYRGYGLSDGRPTATYLLADALAVYEKVDPLLAAHGLPRKSLFVMGRSLGSAAAIEIAQRAGGGISGLIIESGFANTLPLLTTMGLRWELEGADEARDGFGNLAKIARVDVPTLIIHGQEDRLIPIENGRTLYERCGAADKRLMIIPRAGHNDLLFVGQAAYFEAIRTFISGADA